MKYASIGPIAVHLPKRVEDNRTLQEENPTWPIDLIYQKTGIYSRHVAGPDEYASDLAVAASEKLFEQYNVEPSSIDFLLLCTQTPDYPLPTTACLVQDRLGLRTSIGALDFNLGCSGFVYGLSLADGLIQSGAAERILLVTSETYSKYIDPSDRALRTIFGDGAAATLLDASDQQSIGPFNFGTDGSGGDKLMVTEHGARQGDGAIQPSKRKRWGSSLYMDGPELVKFTLEAVPESLNKIFGESDLDRDDIDYYLMHQATTFMLDHLRERLGLDPEKMPVNIRDIGNTVSATLPILINDLRRSGKMRPGKQSVLAGYGVGLSWASCLWQETFVADQVSIQPDLFNEARSSRAA
jgi:3-oxoacyl-[acyl-carrier-protein] synthase III